MTLLIHHVIAASQPMLYLSPGNHHNALESSMPNYQGKRVESSVTSLSDKSSQGLSEISSLASPKQKHHLLHL